MSFGGSLLEGKRKSRRPVATRTPLHVVLKSHRHDLHRRARRISAVISRHTVVRNHVVHANHIHLEVRVRSRESWCRFIRSLTAELAIFLGPGVWRLRPWTRPVVWGVAVDLPFCYAL
ncbi:MAG: hypothetical protein HUU37_10735 [Bdellovibrionales bacterium]|nr:hypothetical protein [Bdellovibrionales bacterium]